MNHQFQGNIPELNYVKEPDSTSIDSPLTRCDLVILHRLDACPEFAQNGHTYCLTKYLLSLFRESRSEIRPTVSLGNHTSSFDSAKLMGTHSFVAAVQF
jgi:hypothetical protein